MALGGGTFQTQNKVLPGSYINFISVAKANANLSDRGYVAVPLILDYGNSGEIIEVEKEDFIKNSVKLFGYDYTHEKLKPIREIFLNAKKLYTYCLNENGTRASNIYAESKKQGIRGNDFKINIGKSVDKLGYYIVSLLLDNKVINTQEVKEASELVDDDYVVYKKDSVLTETAGTPLEGGSNGTVNSGNHQKFLNLLENYSFNILGCPTDEKLIKSLYNEYTKRMRDEVGAKFQLVVYNYAADYEGTINIKNNIELVYWISGLLAGCLVNKSTLNTKYTGEYEVDTKYTQTELIKSIENGEYVLHKVGDDIRVLEDINSLITTTKEKGEVFKSNQTIRVIDQIATDIAKIFNTKYLGIIPNNESGRIGLWADIVKHHEQLQDIGAIENFKDSDVIVTSGETKKAVVVSDYITVVNAMSKLYMTVRVG